MDSVQQDEHQAAPARPAKFVVGCAARHRRGVAVRPSPRARPRPSRSRRRRAVLRAPGGADGMEGRSEPAVVRASRFHRDLSARRRLPRARGPVPRCTAVRGGAVTRRAVPQRSHELLRDRPALGDPVERRDDPAAVPGGAARVRRPHRDRGRVLLGAGSARGELRQHRADRRRRRVLRPALALVVSRGARRPAPAPLRARRRRHRPGRRLALFHGRARAGAGRGLVDRALRRPESRDTAHPPDRTGRGVRVVRAHDAVLLRRLAHGVALARGRDRRHRHQRPFRLDREPRLLRG